MIGDSQHIQILEEDRQKAWEDPDFSEDVESNVKEIVLTDFTECDIYECCDMPRKYSLFLILYF
jgi:hypothetical protein